MSTVIGFDLYGTLLSTASISRELATLYGEEKATRIAAEARRHQLEYTWRINSMGLYRSFSDLTLASFRHAAAEVGVEVSASEEERIMGAYNGLDTFPDVAAAMQLLSETASLDPWVFSNGTVSMITSSIKSSPLLAQAGGVFQASKVISVDPLQVFKPHPRTYEHLVKTTGMEAHRDRVWLVSSNPFDAVGAVAAGLKCAWVDRAGQGWVDGLGHALGNKPTVVVRGVDEAVKEILSRSDVEK